MKHPPAAGVAAAAAPAPTAASVDVAIIRDRFNFDWATSDPVEGLDTYWWWVRSIRVDPNEVIADDGEGNLWSVSFETDGGDEITFGEPIRVRETFVPVGAADGVAATAVVSRRRQREVAASLARPDKPNRGTTAATAAPPNNPTRRSTAMDAAELRERLGIPETIPDEEIEAAMAEVTPEPDPAPEPVPEPEPTPTPAPDEPEVPEGMVLIGADRLAQLEQSVERVDELVSARATEERDTFLNQMASEGRLSRAERSYYERQYALDREGTVAHLSARTPVVPVHERGHAGSTPAAASADAVADFNRTRFGRAIARQEV